MRPEKDKIYLHALNLIEEFNFQRIKRLFEVFKSFEKIWALRQKELTAFFERKGTLNNFLKVRDRINPEKEWERLKEKEISFLTPQEKDYPEELLVTPWPPLGLYIKGSLRKTSPKVAIVGTRRATAYGREAAAKIAETLSESGVTVISGLALGIDAAAHTGALLGSGGTWAVLGSGLNKIYPKINLGLSQKILKNGGVIISEYPPEMEARDWTFPERNRIVAGLTKLALIIEAPEKSGALITARLALEAGREVGILPGDVYRANCLGSNRLLREGAHPVLGAEDVLYLIGITPQENSRKLDKLDEIEESILQCLNEGKNADEIISETKLKPQLVSQKLMELELKNIIKQNAGTWHKII